jgi:hypothetical protein
VEKALKLNRLNGSMGSGLVTCHLSCARKRSIQPFTFSFRGMDEGYAQPTQVSSDQTRPHSPLFLDGLLARFEGRIRAGAGRMVQVNRLHRRPRGFFGKEGHRGA